MEQTKFYIGISLLIFALISVIPIIISIFKQKRYLDNDLYEIKKPDLSPEILDMIIAELNDPNVSLVRVELLNDVLNGDYEAKIEEGKLKFKPILKTKLMITTYN